MPINDDEGESRRQVARRAQRVAGDKSAEIARALMGVPASTLAKLGLDDDLLRVLNRARGTSAMIARRREERALAGALRRVDLVALVERLAIVQKTGSAHPEMFHDAERWRDRLIAEGNTAIDMFVTTFPGARQLPLGKFVAEAKRERETGRPPGASRALFRQVISAMKPAEPSEEQA